MDNRMWMDHLRHWQDFLNIRYAQVDDNGEKAKIVRQLRAIEDVKHAAVLNPELMIEFIRPTREPVSLNKEIEYMLHLNDSQKHAVSIALGDNVLSLIQGPPGTGKTQVIAEICLQLYQMNPDIHILVCSETHIAVKEVNSRDHRYRFQSGGFGNGRCRCGLVPFGQFGTANRCSPAGYRYDLCGRSNAVKK